MCLIFPCRNCIACREFRLPPIPDESFEEFKDRQLVRFLETQMPRAVAANDNDNNNNNNNPKAGGYQNVSS